MTKENTKKESPTTEARKNLFNLFDSKDQSLMNQRILSLKSAMSDFEATIQDGEDTKEVRQDVKQAVKNVLKSIDEKLSPEKQDAARELVGKYYDNNIEDKEAYKSGGLPLTFKELIKQHPDADSRASHREPLNNLDGVFQHHLQVNHRDLKVQVKQEVYKAFLGGLMKNKAYI